MPQILPHRSWVVVVGQTITMCLSSDKSRWILWSSSNPNLINHIWRRKGGNSWISEASNQWWWGFTTAGVVITTSRWAGEGRCKGNRWFIWQPVIGWFWKLICMFSSFAITQINGTSLVDSKVNNALLLFAYMIHWTFIDGFHVSRLNSDEHSYY